MELARGPGYSRSGEAWRGPRHRKNPERVDGRASGTVPTGLEQQFQLLEQAACRNDVIQVKGSGKLVDPLALRGLDPPKCPTSRSRQAKSLRARVGRIFFIGRQPFINEKVGHALDALPGKIHRTRDLGDGAGRTLDYSHDLPASR